MRRLPLRRLRLLRLPMTGVGCGRRRGGMLRCGSGCRRRLRCPNRCIRPRRGRAWRRRIRGDVGRAPGNGIGGRSRRPGGRPRSVRRRCAGVRCGPGRRRIGRASLGVLRARRLGIRPGRGTSPVGGRRDIGGPRLPRPAGRAVGRARPDGGRVGRVLSQRLPHTPPCPIGEPRRRRRGLAGSEPLGRRLPPRVAPRRSLRHRSPLGRAPLGPSLRETSGGRPNWGAIPRHGSAAVAPGALGCRAVAPGRTIGPAERRLRPGPAVPEPRPGGIGRRAARPVRRRPDRRPGLRSSRFRALVRPSHRDRIATWSRRVLPLGLEPVGRLRQAVPRSGAGVRTARPGGPLPSAELKPEAEIGQRPELRRQADIEAVTKIRLEAEAQPVSAAVIPAAVPAVMPTASGCAIRSVVGPRPVPRCSPRRVPSRRAAAAVRARVVIGPLGCLALAASRIESGLRGAGLLTLRVGMGSQADQVQTQSDGERHGPSSSANRPRLSPQPDEELSRTDRVPSGSAVSDRAAPRVACPAPDRRHPWARCFGV